MPEFELEYLGKKINNIDDSKKPEELSNNNQNEIYLTDIVEIANNEDKKIGLKICEDQSEVMGINSSEDLLKIESMLMESWKYLDFKTLQIL